MACKNENLTKAKREKNDEFYTLLTDIEKEMKHYKEQFKDKVVYCNCDDARQSNFFKYFSLNFEYLGLKKLITTSYNANGNGTILVYEGDKNGNRIVDDEEIQVSELNGNGDFRSEECLELLKQADIVVTNPPFSLFREYVSVLFEHDKKFCVIGSMNAIGYKEFFPYIKDGKVWFGLTAPKQFEQPNGIIKKFGNILWFTNLETKRQGDTITLIKTYNETDYPKYDNYDAINVDKTKDIPYDYEGAIGVPISALNYLCSDGLLHFDVPLRTINIESTEKRNITDFSYSLYKIIGLGIANLGLSIGVRPYKEEHRKYRKEVQKRGVVNGDLYMIINNKVEVPYSRILIQRVN